MVEKTLILENAISTFTSLGIKQVSIDDICSNLSIAKKDFYKHYEEKSVLINEFLEAEFNSVFETYRQMKRTYLSALEVMVRYNQFLMRQLHTKNPVVLQDLKEFYPENYATYNSLRRKVTGTLEDLLTEGMRQKQFRQDLVPAHLAELRAWQLESIVLPPADGERYSPEYHEQVFQHYIYGIAGFRALGAYGQTSLN